MFWLRRPPYVRWAAAGLILVAALMWDLRRGATEPYPFAGRDFGAGEVIQPSDVDWRDLPVGALQRADLEGVTAVVPIRRGEPLTAPLLSAEPDYPDDWWAVPVAISATAVPGSTVRLLILEPPLTVDGIVSRAGSDDSFSLGTTGLVAVPGDMAARVAGAAVDGNLVVLERP